MLSYIWNSMLVVLVGGIGWSVVSFVLGVLILGLVAVFFAIFGDEFDKDKKNE